MWWFAWNKSAVLARPKKNTEEAKAVFVSYELTAGQKHMLKLADLANSVEFSCFWWIGIDRTIMNIGILSIKQMLVSENLWNSSNRNVK